MAKLRDIPLGTYPPATYALPVRALQNGLAGIVLGIGRCTSADPTIWSDPATTIRIDLQFSYDGGVTYTELGANGWQGNGGIKVAKGVELAEEPVTFRFTSADPAFANGPTHMKGQAIVAGGAVKTYVDVTTF